MQITVKGYIYLMMDDFVKTEGTEKDAAVCCTVQMWRWGDVHLANLNYVFVGEKDMQVDIDLDAIRGGAIETLTKKSEHLKAEHFKAQQEIADQIANLKCITFNPDAE